MHDRFYRDSLGVPNEPDEPKVVATDWKGDPIHEGEEFRRTYAGEKVLTDEVNLWIDDVLSKPETL